MKHRLHKIPFFTALAFFIAFLFSGIYAHAAQGTQSGYQLLAEIPDSVMGKSSGITLVDYMKGLFVATIGLAIVLAVVELVIGGIEYVAAAVPSAKEDAKKRIGGAIGGLLLILIAWVLLQALNPKLLNVGLNLQPVGGGGGQNNTGGTTGQQTNTGTQASTQQQQYCLVNSMGQIAGGAPTDKASCEGQIGNLALTCQACSTNP